MLLFGNILIRTLDILYRLPKKRLVQRAISFSSSLSSDPELSREVVLERDDADPVEHVEPEEREEEDEDAELLYGQDDLLRPLVGLAATAPVALGLLVSLVQAGQRRGHPVHPTTRGSARLLGA